MIRSIFKAGRLALAIVIASSGLNIAFTGSAAAEMKTIEVHWPSGECDAIVAYNQQLPVWLTSIFNDFHMNYVTTCGNVAKAQTYADVAEEACTEYAKTSNPSVFVDVLGNVFIYGAAGSLYGPLVSAVDSVFKGSEMHNSAAVGSSDALGGLANGLVSQSKRQVSFVDCTRVLLGRHPKFDVAPISSN